MSRLTEKENYRSSWVEEITTDEYIALNYSTGKCIDKLGKLEDIEEELGCPLEVVFKALNNGIYYSYDKYDYGWFSLNDEYDEYTPKGKIIFEDAPKLQIPNGSDWVFKGKILNQPNVVCCFLKDYKKTWWLKKNREE